MANVVGVGNAGTMIGEYISRPDGIALYGGGVQRVEQDRTVRDRDYYCEVSCDEVDLFESHTPAEIVGGEGPPPRIRLIRRRWECERVGRADAVATGGYALGRRPSVECWNAELEHGCIRVGTAASANIEQGVATTAPWRWKSSESRRPS